MIKRGFVKNAGFRNGNWMSCKNSGLGIVFKVREMFVFTLLTPVTSLIYHSPLVVCF